jgi:hypothetical protein
LALHVLSGLCVDFILKYHSIFVFGSKMISFVGIGKRQRMMPLAPKAVDPNPWLCSYIPSFELELFFFLAASLA